MKKDIFDTNILIKYKVSVQENSFFSAVVLQEMTTGSTNDKELKLWQAFEEHFEKKGLLLVPNGQDWFEVGKVLNYLMRGIKSKGKTKKISFYEAQRIIRDVLIA